MDPVSFCYWLRGFFEIAGEGPISKEQAEIISKHLTLVFKEEAKSMDLVSQLKQFKTGFIPSDESLKPKLCSTATSVSTAGMGIIASYLSRVCFLCGQEKTDGETHCCPRNTPYEYPTTISC